MEKKLIVECEAYSKEYMEYLSVAKTERRAYSQAVKLLEKAGFKDISKFNTLKPGDKVYRGYHGKTVMAAIVGRKPMVEGIRVVGGHTDAPRLDFKPKPLYEKDGVVYFDTHIYGGIKKFQWLVLPLAIYGTIVKKNGVKVEVAIGDKPGDPVFMISDYWYSVKRNWKQGLIMGMLDFMCITALTVNFTYYNQLAGSYGYDLMLFFTVALSIIYSFMRMYIYLMVITFDMKSTKILKNALIFSIVGVKRNIMAVLCILAFILVVAIVTFLLHYIKIAATGVLIGFLTLFASASFISTYCAYPVILKYMVIQDDETDEQEEEEEEAVVAE